MRTGIAIRRLGLSLTWLATLLLAGNLIAAPLIGPTRSAGNNDNQAWLYEKPDAKETPRLRAAFDEVWEILHQLGKALRHGDFKTFFHLFSKFFDRLGHALAVLYDELKMAIARLEKELRHSRCKDRACQQLQ